MKPGHHAFNAVSHAPLRQGGAVDQDHRQAKVAGSNQLGLCPAATSIFGNDRVDFISLQQVNIVRFGKRPSGDDRRAMGQRQRIGRIDKSQDIMVLRLCRKGCQVLAADSQKHVLRGPVQGGDGRRNVGHADPAVSPAGLPRRALQRNQRRSGLRCCEHGMVAHLCRKRVGSVDQMGDPVIAKVAQQPVNAAESANSGGDRLWARIGDAPGIRQGGGKASPGHGHRQQARLGGAAQDQDIRHG